METTNSDEIAFDEQLRHWNRVGAQTLSDLLLHFPAHEHVSFHEFDQVSPEDLSDLQAPLVRASDYAHGGRVQHNFAGFFFLPRLKHGRVERILIIPGPIDIHAHNNIHYDNDF